MPLVFTQITGTFDDGSGSTLSGTAAFTPSATVYAAGIPVLSAGVPVQAEIVNGALLSSSGGTLRLLATDNSGLTYEGLTGFFYWTVTVTISGQIQPSWSFFLPSSPSTVDLYSLAHTTAGGGGGSGFANPMTTLGDLIDGGASGVATRLPGDTSNTRKFLRTQASSGVAQAPAWDTLQAGDVPALSYDASGAAATAQSNAATYAAGLVTAETTRAVTAEALALPKTGGTMSGPVAMGSSKVTGLGNGSASSDAAAFGQIPAALPPNGSAGGVLSGSYPNPGFAATPLPESGGTMTGWLAPAVAALTDGATIAVNAALGNVFTVTLGGNRTLSNPTNPVAGQTIHFHVTQDGTGSRTLAYGTAYDFGTAGAPALTATAGKMDILGFTYDGGLSKWCCLGSGLGF